MKSKESVDVVIVNYNAGAVLLDCVRSVLPQCRRVIVVDNASHDDSLALLEQDASLMQQTHIIRNDQNLGFAKACNIGAHAAEGSHLLFLNPDCVAANDALETLLKVLESDDSIGMVGGQLLNPDGSEQAGGRRNIPRPSSAFVRAFGLSTLFPNTFKSFDQNQEPTPKQPIQVEAISGACMMLSREFFEQIQGWDDDYFLHCEDLDICMRINLSGKTILFVPDAHIVHQKGVCSQSRPIFVEWHKHKGMMRFYRLFFRKQYPLPVWWLVVAGIWLRFAAVAVVYSIKKLKTK